MSLDEAIGQLEKLVAEVKQASLTDDKTTLGSALALGQEARSINQGTSEFNVIAFADLNNFKNLNDQYGHNAGDVALNKVGETVYNIVIKGWQAKAFRKSGDEFVFLLKQDLIERLFSALPSFSSIPFLYNEKELSVALSIGYARSDGKTSFDDLLGRAEVACQFAKAQGHGTCIEWTDELLLNPLVRIGAQCRKCSAKITCTLPKENAPIELRVCPCCGEALHGSRSL
jgi:diguanylate cyclase (GGDEF)-like protein